MSKMMVWLCKQLLKQVEYHKRQLGYYETKLNSHLKALPADDFFLFCIYTGYPESAVKRRLNKNKEYSYKPKGY